MAPTTLHDAIEIGRKERYLAVVATVRADATIQSSVVNAGVLAHPQGGDEAEQGRTVVLVNVTRVYSN